MTGDQECVFVELEVSLETNVTSKLLILLLLRFITKKLIYNVYTILYKV